MSEDLKKQIIIEILKKLSWIWIIADWLIAIISSQYITPNSLDGLIYIIKNSIDNFTDEEQKEKLEIWLKKLKYLKHLEKNETINKEKELDLLKNMLNNI
jgi:hypothetical protein